MILLTKTLNSIAERTDVFVRNCKAKKFTQLLFVLIECICLLLTAYGSRRLVWRREARRSFAHHPRQLYHDGVELECSKSSPTTSACHMMCWLVMTSSFALSFCLSIRIFLFLLTKTLNSIAERTDVFVRNCKDKIFTQLLFVLIECIYILFLHFNHKLSTINCFSAHGIRLLYIAARSPALIRTSSPPAVS